MVGIAGGENDSAHGLGGPGGLRPGGALDAEALAVAPPDPGAANGTADISAPAWAQRSVPAYLNYRKVSIYSGSSEVQRQIIDKAVLGL